MNGFVEDAVGKLRETGYCLLPGVIEPTECDRLKQILEQAHRTFAPHYVGHAAAAHRLNFHQDERIVFNTHNKDRAFLKLIDLPPVFDIVEALLQEGSYRKADPVILRQNTARTPVAGTPAQQLHIDSRLPGCSFPLMAVVTWMLDDFTEDNGATRLVPGSHRRASYPEDGVVDAQEILVCGKQGSVLIMDGGLWHGGGENRTGASRWCILSTYVRWFFKSAFDFNRNMPRPLYQALTDRQKRVMGYCCNPPLDEFTRIRARSEEPETPAPYALPPAAKAGASPTRRDQRWLVAVCAGRWQLHGIGSAMDAGLKVLALDGDPLAPGLAVADQAAVVDIRDPARVLAAVREAKIRPAGAVAFAADAGMRAVGELREAFGLPGPGRGPLLTLVNKVLQRRTGDAAGLPNPPWRVARTAAAAAAALAAIGPPAIVKPADSAGSRGVTRIDPGEPWDNAVARAFAASRAGEIIVEATLPGTEYTVETFAIAGEIAVLAVTEKRKVPGTKGTVADELATPDLPESAVRRIAEVACAALGAVGYDDGPGHVEVMFDRAAGPGLIEAAGRGAGFMVFDGLVPTTSGYQIAAQTALQAVGIEPQPVPEGRRPVVLRFFPSRAGVVREFAGFDKANRLDGVVAAPFVEIGQRVGVAHADADRLGYLLTSAATVAESRRLADEAETLIRFHIEPPA